MTDLDIQINISRIVNEIKFEAIKATLSSEQLLKYNEVLEAKVPSLKKVLEPLLPHDKVAEWLDALRK